MIKKMMGSFVLATGLLVSSFSFGTVADASSAGNCSIAIDANKHINGSYVNATGDCSGFIVGDVTPSGQAAISGLVNKVVLNGEVVTFSIPRKGQYNLTVSVIPKKAEPKPTPKPEPKPKPKPEAKPSPKPTPKPESKPNPTPTTKREQPKKETTKQESSEPATESKKEVSNSIASSTTTKQNDVKEKEKLTLIVLKDQKENVHVKKDGNKTIAVVTNDNGNKVEQEITKQEAEALKIAGADTEKEVTDLLEEEIESPDLNLNKEESESELKDMGKKDDKKSKSSFGNIIVSILTVTLLAVGGMVLYRKRKK